MPNRIDVLAPPGADLYQTLRAALDVLEDNRVAVLAAAQMLDEPAFGRILLAHSQDIQEAVRLLAQAGFRLAPTS